MTKSKEEVWTHYIQYLKDWAESHSESGFYSMSPATFDEWIDNEYSEENEV